MQEAVEKFISTWCSVFSAECTDFAPINMKNTHTMCRSDYRLCSIRINYCFPFSSHFDSTNRSQNELTKAILFAHIFTSTEKIPHLYIYIRECYGKQRTEVKCVFLYREKCIRNQSVWCQFQIYYLMRLNLRDHDRNLNA